MKKIKSKIKRIPVTEKDIEAIVDFAIFRVQMGLKIKSELQRLNIFVNDSNLETLTSESILTILRKKKKL